MLTMHDGTDHRTPHPTHYPPPLNLHAPSHLIPSTQVKIRELMEPMMRILDGCTDIKQLMDVNDLEEIDVDYINDNEMGDEEEFDPVVEYDLPSDRWKTESDSVVVTQSKRALVEAMEQISDLRANFRLGRLLHYFKTLNDTHNGRRELEKLQVRHHLGSVHTKPLTPTLNMIMFYRKN